MVNIQFHFCPFRTSRSKKTFSLLTDHKKKNVNDENKQNVLHTHLHQESASSGDILHNNNLHNQQQQQSNNNQQGNISSMPNISQNQQLSWTCELCGRMFATRDEWSIHAKSHLEVISCAANWFEETKMSNFAFTRFQY